VFRNLVVDDPAAAGRLLLALLPAQRAADPQPVSYDLLIAERTCISVTVDSDSTRVHAGADPQPDADFQVRGVPDAVVRLLLAGRLRRAVGWRIARVTGDKRRLAALERLIDPPLTLRDLHAEGVRLDPALALAVIGLMIEPSWTRGEKFTIAHQLAGAPHPDGYLNVPGGSLASVAERPLPDAPTTIVVCSADALVPALAGDHVPELFVRGDPRPLELLAGWLDRAQSA
jgi:hypothetical protein